MCEKKIWLAFAISPMLPSAFFVFAFHLTDLRLATFVLLFSITFSYVPCLLFGVPLIKFLEKRGSLNIVNMTMWGSFLGMITFYFFGFIISSILGSPKNDISALKGLVSGALLGIAVALPFSFIAGFPLFGSWQRPSSEG